MSIVAPDLAALRAADVSNISMIYDHAIFTWTTGDFTGQADDVNIVASDDVSFSQGAWVRQKTASIVHNPGGTSGINRPVIQVIADYSHSVANDGVTFGNTIDQTAAIAATFSRGRAAFLPGRAYVNSDLELPGQFILEGGSTELCGIVLGPSGRLIFQGPPAPAGQMKRALTLRDIVIATNDPITSLSGPNFVVKNGEFLTFENCIFYNLGLHFDSHYGVAFRRCKFFGPIPGAGFLSTANDSPEIISSLMNVEGCWSSGFKWELVDTVEARFIGSQIFGGEFGIKSYRDRTAGTTNPFWLGPSILECTFDSISGRGIDIRDGGTKCSIEHSFFSCGRKSNTVADAADTESVYLEDCRGAKVIGNDFEWSGTHLLRLHNCADIPIIGNKFYNPRDGAGIYAGGSRGIIVTENHFANLLMNGGSNAGENGNTGMNLAIETFASDAVDWLVKNNRIVGMLNSNGVYISGSPTANSGNNIVADNMGISPSTVRPIRMGTTVDRPTVGLYDGYAFYDLIIRKNLFWDGSTSQWKDALGAVV